MIPTSLMLILVPLVTLVIYGGVFALFRYWDTHGPCSLCTHSRSVWHSAEGCMAGAADGSKCGCSGVVTLTVVRRA